MNVVDSTRYSFTPAFGEALPPGLPALPGQTTGHPGTVGTFDWDIRAGTNTWSPELYAIYGLSPADYNGSFEDWKRYVVPEDIPLISTQTEAAFATGEFVCEWRIIRQYDGEIRRIKGRGRVVFSESGEPIRMLGVNIDVTARPAGNSPAPDASATASPIEAAGPQGELIESVLRCLPCCVALIAGDDLTYRLINPAYQAIAPGKQIEGRTIFEVWPELQPRFEEICLHTLQTGIPHHRTDEPSDVSRVAGAPRETAYFTWSMHRIPMPSGQGFGLLITGYDTTDRKRAELSLVRAEKIASVVRLASSIAHEINNPLAALMNLLYLAELDAGDPAAVRSRLAQAQDELKRISHVTRQTLAFYREDSAPAFTPLQSILDSAADSLGSKIARGRIYKRYRRPVAIRASPGELRQVFSNLLANSLEAIPQDGPIHLRVSCTTLPHSKGQAVRITIADKGSGIAPAHLPRIFEPLFTTKDATGSGLGLWVARRIVEQHGGSIRVRSRDHGSATGSVFTVTLPLEPQHRKATLG